MPFLFRPVATFSKQALKLVDHLLMSLLVCIRQTFPRMSFADVKQVGLELTIASLTLQTLIMNHRHRQQAPVHFQKQTKCTRVWPFSTFFIISNNFCDIFKSVSPEELICDKDTGRVRGCKKSGRFVLWINFGDRIGFGLVQTFETMSFDLISFLKLFHYRLLLNFWFLLTILVNLLFLCRFLSFGLFAQHQSNLRIVENFRRPLIVKAIFTVALVCVFRRGKRRVFGQFKFEDCFAQLRTCLLKIQISSFKICVSFSIQISRSFFFCSVFSHFFVFSYIFTHFLLILWHSTLLLILRLLLTLIWCRLRFAHIVRIFHKMVILV